MEEKNPTQMLGRLLFTLKGAALTTQGVHAYQRSARKQYQYKAKNWVSSSHMLSPSFQKRPLDASNAKYVAEPKRGRG